MTQCTQCLHGAKIQMIIVTVKLVTYPQGEEANKDLSGSLEIKYSSAEYDIVIISIYINELSDD